MDDNNQYKASMQHPASGWPASFAPLTGPYGGINASGYDLFPQNQQIVTVHPAHPGSNVQTMEDLEKVLERELENYFNPAPIPSPWTTQSSETAPMAVDPAMLAEPPQHLSTAPTAVGPSMFNMQPQYVPNPALYPLSTAPMAVGPSMIGMQPEYMPTLAPPSLSTAPMAVDPNGSHEQGQYNPALVHPQYQQLAPQHQHLQQALPPQPPTASEAPAAFSAEPSTTSAAATGPANTSVVKRGRGRPKKAPEDKILPFKLHCRYCRDDKKYKGVEGLKQHMSVKHGLIAPGTQGAVSCDECGWTFSRQSDLTRHNRANGPCRTKWSWISTLPTAIEDLADTFGGFGQCTTMSNSLICGREHMDGRSDPRVRVPGSRSKDTPESNFSTEDYPESSSAPSGGTQPDTTLPCSSAQSTSAPAPADHPSQSPPSMGWTDLTTQTTPDLGISGLVSWPSSDPGLLDHTDWTASAVAGTTDEAAVGTATPMPAILDEPAWMQNEIEGPAPNSMAGWDFLDEADIKALEESKLLYNEQFADASLPASDPQVQHDTHRHSSEQANELVPQVEESVVPLEQSDQLQPETRLESFFNFDKYYGRESAKTPQ